MQFPQLKSCARARGGGVHPTDLMKDGRKHQTPDHFPEELKAFSTFFHQRASKFRHSKERLAVLADFICSKAVTEYNRRF